MTLRKIKGSRFIFLHDKISSSFVGSQKSKIILYEGFGEFT